ncbi:MAG: hypothetical protein JW888_16695 [Pirellulales bacterium]|nr:hypothetical protein [Pirellulales bacterium]
MGQPRRDLTFLAILLVTATGTGCPRMMNQYSGMPRALPPQPSLEQVIQTVNANSSRIESFSTNRATITISGLPQLRASVAMQRPRCFRLQGDMPMTAGPEFDLGSNDEEFWLWFRADPQKAVYYCRHDRFCESAAQGRIPIAPAELIDALGLAEFDPALPHQRPIVRRDGNLEIRTIRETAEGPVMKVTVVDAYGGWINEQHFYDAAGRLALSTVARQHRRDPASGLIMPRVVVVNCPQQKFKMQINLGDVAINTLLAARPGLWDRPQYEGSRQVDLGDPNLRFDQAPMAQIPSPNAAATSRALHQRSW